MTSPRSNATATLLPGPNPQVLIAGGFGSSIAAPGLNTAELYDPVAQTFLATTGAMTSGHVGHTATLLGNGQVLIIGGEAPSNASLTVAELYHPSTGTFSATASLTRGRSLHGAALLGNGKVLATGGYSTFGSVTENTAEVYDPATGTFSTQGLAGYSRAEAGTALLSDGTVLTVGGIENGSISSVPAETYTPGP
jgi:Kelch motif